MEYFLLMFSKIMLLIVLISVGILLRCKGIITRLGMKDLSKLLVDVFWPALIFISIVKNLSPQDLIANIYLPLGAVITALTGTIIGIIVIKLNKWEGARKNIFLYHSTINNFVFMILPFAEFFIPGKGAGLLFIHNLGYIVILWTVGVALLTKTESFKDHAKSLLSPGLIATFAGILFVITGLADIVPKGAVDIFQILGNCTIPVAMIIAGGQIASLGREALKFDKWNMQLGFVRLIAVPVLLMVPSYFLMKYTSISREMLIIFMLVNLAPVSVNSVSMAIRFKADADLTAEGVVFTHIFSIFTMMFFLWVWKDFFIGLI